MYDETTLRAIAHDVCTGKATAEQQKYVVAFYEKVFRHRFDMCHCALCDAVVLILRNIKKMEAKYRLKKGIVLRRHGLSYRLTHTNITDQLAEEHLKARPGDAKFFDLLPVKKVVEPIIEAEPVTEESVIEQAEKIVVKRTRTKKAKR